MKSFCKVADFTLYMLISDICKETEEGVCRNNLNMGLL